MMLTSSVFDDFRKVKAGFFGRQGGVSEGEYASLNCGFGSGDNLDKVAENRAIVSEKLTGERLPVCTVFQHHSADVVLLEKPWKWEDSPKADAIITRQKGVVIGALAADCVPILMAEPTGFIAAIHSGWKGAIGGIIENTISRIAELGGDIANIHAAIGPAIGKNSYEVGQEFFEKFKSDDLQNERYFTSKTLLPEKYLFDLKGFVEAKLRAAKVKSLEVLPHDTLPDEKLFFSFRRATLAGRTIYGRQISAIVLG